MPLIKTTLARCMKYNFSYVFLHAESLGDTEPWLFPPPSHFPLFARPGTQWSVTLFVFVLWLFITISNTLKIMYLN